MAGPNLARMIGEPERHVQLRQAVVTAVAGDGTLSLKLGNSATAIAGIRSLGTGVVVGNVVWVLQQGYDLLALGRIMDSPYGSIPQGGTTPWLEVRNTGGDAYIDFTRTPGTADYNMRIINNTPGYLEVFGGRLRVGWAEMGTHPVHTSYAWFGRTAQAGGSDYSFLTNGSESIVNATGNCYLSRNGAWRYQSGDVHISRGAGEAELTVNDTNTFRMNYGATLANKQLFFRAWNDTWHRQYWDSGFDGLRIQEYQGIRVSNVDGEPLWANGAGIYANLGWFRTRGDRGLYNEDQGRGLYFTGGHVVPYPDGTTFRVTKHDHIGNWDVTPLWVESRGGGSGARISFRAAGQNAAPQIKSWGEAIEFRSWNDSYMIVTRSVVENYCQLAGKENLRQVADRVPKARRKQILKDVKPKHFNRRHGGCPACVGTGHKGQNRRLYDERARAVGALLAGVDDGPCPDCNGEGIAWERPEARKNEEAGWVGFVAEELEPIVPEAVFYRQDEDGEIRPSGLDHMALIALLWEEVNDLEARLESVEKVPAVALGKVKK